MRRISRAAAAVAATAAVSAAGLVSTATPAGAAGFISVVSVDAGGAPVHKVTDVAMSDDGNRIAFVANSDGQRNLLLRDRAAGTTTELVPNGTSFARISGDGNTVVYVQGLDRVMAYDVPTGTTTQVNLAPDGGLPAAGTSSVPGGVSDDGRFVVFRYGSSPFVGHGVFLRDRVAGTTKQVSTLPPALDPTSFGPGAVSNDGSTVAFSASVAVPGNPFRTFEAFVWRTGVVDMASVDNAGVAATRDAFASDLSADGRYVVFETDAKLDPADPNTSSRDVYVRDLTAASTSFVGANFGDDDPGLGSNSEGRITDDGASVVFGTTAMIAGKWTNDPSVVVANRATGTVSAVSIDVNGSPTYGTTPDVSPDGRFVAFSSIALNLVPPFDVSSCVEFEEDEDNPWNQIPNYGNCSNAYVADRAATGGIVPAGGGTVSTAPTATATEPLAASVQVPSLGTPGTVSIAPGTGTVPDGYDVLGQQLSIEAPVATWDNPLRLTFTVDSSLGVAPADIAIIRDGVPIVDCAGSLTALPPDATSADGHPCVTSRGTNAEGDAVLVVLTPHASVWTAAKVPPPADPDVTFAGLCEATQAALGQKGVAQSMCAKLSAASASRDRGDGPSAAKQLDAYRSEVAAQAGKTLTSAQATTLTDQSRLL